MSARRASLVDAQQAEHCVQAALKALRDRRAGADAPLDYARRVRNPWTRDLAVELALEIDRVIPGADTHRHEISGKLGALNRVLPDMSARLAEGGPYPVSWRVYAADDSALLEQPAVIAAQWRGVWSHLSRACDDLAQARAGLRVLLTQADPDRDVDGLNLATACAYRISAYAPPGEAVLLAFYGPEGGWRDTAGFALYRYRTGDQHPTRLETD